MITAVVLAAAASRRSFGAAAVAGLTATYLISVLLLAGGARTLSAAQRATA